LFLSKNHTSLSLIMRSITLHMQLVAKTITHPAARSLCDSWASC